ncbi:hypothetical protein [Geomicrobium sp. JCM 19039]|uniref:hypothetical protein n=1 Tax=Geomicrobium sp. JCM 19039 TaxID=1460636 RepID=UPI00045F44A9|nr:hypothetical protein [Geomicrobium sp. JCM 19039]GAK13314.1 transglutaminase-like enzyme [Geomicrobium sp. JCM 19039]
MRSGTSFFQNPQHVFLYLLTYILLAEWLFPLPYFTDTGYVHVFLLLTAFLFVVNAISMHFILRLLFVTAAILYSMHTIFFQDVFLGISWWQTFLSMTFEQTLLIFTGDLYALNEMYRSFLFMILLALMSFLTFYWVVYVRRMMFFFICSVIYVAVLDTFTLYDGAWAMLRLFIIGFVLVAHLKMSRLSLTYMNISMRHWWRWSIVTLLVVSIATTAAVSAPKLTPQWPNPVPFIQAAGGFGTEYDTGNRRIGYGDHDDRLGGGFEMDDTPVMYASVDNLGIGGVSPSMCIPVMVG